MCGWTGEKRVFKLAISTREWSKEINEMSRDKSSSPVSSFRSLLTHHFSAPVVHMSRRVLGFSRGWSFFVIILSFV